MASKLDRVSSAPPEVGAAAVASVWTAASNVDPVILGTVGAMSKFLLESSAVGDCEREWLASWRLVRTNLVRWSCHG